MRCKSWNDGWVAYLYQELPSDAKRAMLEHLEGCPACRKTMDELADARRLLAASPDVPTVPWVRTARPSSFGSMRMIGAFAAGVVCAVLCFGLGFFTAGTVGGTDGTASGVTLVEVQREIAEAEKRFNRERGRDLEYLMETMTASEIRTATWKDRTNEALQLIALRQDPRLSER